jgi:hypothetical protein
MFDWSSPLSETSHRPEGRGNSINEQNQMKRLLSITSGLIICYILLILLFWAAIYASSHIPPAQTVQKLQIHLITSGILLLIVLFLRKRVKQKP